MTSCKRIIYFHNGSIGDFLMTLHLMENLHANDSSLKLVLAVPRNLETCRELALSYPFVSIVYANRMTAPFTLMRYARGGNCTVTPPTAGRIPLATKLAARVLSMLPGERMFGFDDGSPLNRLIYGALIPYTKNQLYFESMHDMVRELGYKVKVEQPSFTFKRDGGIYDRFPVQPHNFLIVHPFGSGPHRSILGDDLTTLVAKLKEQYDGTIILSGSAQDGERHKETVDALERDHDVISVAGKLSIHELATILSDAKLYVGVDTGISHLASLLHTKTVVVAHRATTPEWLTLYNPNGSVVYREKGSDRIHFLSHGDNTTGLSPADMAPISAIVEAVIQQL